MDDVAGSMSNGTPMPALSNGTRPADTATMPPLLPRRAENNNAIGNIDDVRGSMADGSVPASK